MGKFGSGGKISSIKGKHIDISVEDMKGFRAQTLIRQLIHFFFKSADANILGASNPAYRHWLRNYVFM